MFEVLSSSSPWIWRENLPSTCRELTIRHGYSATPGSVGCLFRRHSLQRRLPGEVGVVRDLLAARVSQPPQLLVDLLRRHLAAVAMLVMISVRGGLAHHLEIVRQTRLQEAPSWELP